MLNIEVAYASQGRYQVIALSVQEGTTLEQAIIQSAIQHYFPDIDLSLQRVGIFGELKVLTDHVAAGDRVEIYRPLLHNPITARQQRVKQAKAAKQRQRQLKDRV